MLVGIQAGRLPNAHAAEMRPVGIRVTHALDDREPAVVEEFFGGLHLRMKTNMIVELVKFSRIQPESITVTTVAVVGVGDDRIDSVVAAIKLDDDEHPATGLGSRRAGDS